MTIASEISRLQTAKWDMQTSIWNKGVVVPSSAKLDEYASYIDQIQASSWDDILSYMSGILSIDSNMVYVSRSDDVYNRYSDYSWKDGTNLYLVKPYEYANYSSSGHSSIETYVSCVALPKWASSSANYDTQIYSWWWYTSTYIDYYYINWNYIKLYWRTWEYTDHYWCSTISFSNWAWSVASSSWNWQRPEETWGNQGILYTTVVWSMSWGGNFLFKRKPH